MQTTSILLAALIASLFSAQALASDAPRFPIKQYVIEGGTQFKPEVLDLALAGFTGEGRDFGDIQGAMEIVRALYAGQGAVVSVSLPEQELAGGVVRIRAQEAVFSPNIRYQVRAQDGSVASAAGLAALLPEVVPGAGVNHNRLTDRVYALNQLQQTSVDVETHARPDGSVDATVTANAKLPYTVTMDNGGSASTGKFRGMGQAVFDNGVALLGVTSDKPDRMAAAGVTYSRFFPSTRNQLTASYLHSESKTGALPGFLPMAGSGDVASVRYAQVLDGTAIYKHQVQLGADYKTYHTDARPEGGGDSLVPDVGVHPVSVGYKGEYGRQTEFQVGLGANIPGGAKGDQAALEASRAGARAAYTLAQASASYVIDFENGTQFAAHFSSQFTNDALVAGEQFGVGGAASVRGYGERELAGDSGYQGSLEWRSGNLAKALGLPDSALLQGSVFYDFGGVRRNKALPGEMVSARVEGAGVGITIADRSGVFLSLALAQALRTAGQQHAGDWMSHFSVGYRF